MRPVRVRHPSSGFKSLTLGVAAVCGLLISAPSTGARAAEPSRSEPWPTEVHAVYDIEFGGINVGTFEFHSKATGNTYHLEGNAKLSAMLGVLHWKGQSHSTGQIAPETPKPGTFDFDFKSNAKSGSTRIAFTGDAVSSVANEPPLKEKPNVVPVREQHLKGVLDPLSAVMALSRPSGPNPCGRRLAIFDGKQRFDLQLSPHGHTRIVERRPSGQPSVGIVCGVRYVPIAGHKKDEEQAAASLSDKIEIILRPIPSAGVFVPYQITIPTPAGTARLISKRVDIVGAGGRQQIALVH